MKKHINTLGDKQHQISRGDNYNRLRSVRNLTATRIKILHTNSTPKQYKFMAIYMYNSKLFQYILDAVNMSDQRQGDCEGTSLLHSSTPSYESYNKWVSISFLRRL